MAATFINELVRAAGTPGTPAALRPARLDGAGPVTMALLAAGYRVGDVRNANAVDLLAIA
jgi:hypothetical protein